MPPSSAGRSWGSTTRPKQRHGPFPSARAVSSSAGSMPRSAAATGRNTNGRVGDCDHQQRPGEPLQRRGERHPGIGGDERRHGQGRRGENRPGAVEWHVRPFHAPCAGGADDRGQERRGAHQFKRVEQQFADQRSPKQFQRVPPTRTPNACVTVHASGNSTRNGPHAPAASSKGGGTLRCRGLCRVASGGAAAAGAGIRAGRPGAAAWPHRCRHRVA